MKQQLWILNSSLLAIFIAVLITNVLIQQKPIVLPIKKTLVEEEAFKKKAPIIISLDKINKQDIFGTFTEITQNQPSKRSYLTPIPEPKPVFITPPPPPQKQEFIPPLNLNLKGIIFLLTENRSVAMITDETNKEGLYHLGDKIKDGQLLRITKNKVVILRANGQQEILLLRKKEERLGEPPPSQIATEKWNYAVKKIDDKNYEIDPLEFKLVISSLSEFIEKLGLGTAYQKGVPVGLRLSKASTDNLETTIGLNKDDIIIAINEIDISQTKNRIQAFDLISQMKIGDDIKVNLKRNNQDLQINYKIAKVGKPIQKTLFPPGQGPGQPGAFTMSPSQEHENYAREFEKFHHSSNKGGMIADIRQRLLENMRMRNMNRRVR